MKSFEDLVNDGIVNKIAELFPDVVIKEEMEFISVKGMHCRVTMVSKDKKRVGLYDLKAKFAFSIEYEALRKMLANPKVRIL